MVVVIIREHKMSRGKEIAQGSHGFENWLKVRLVGGKLSPEEQAYLSTGTTKVTLQIGTVAEAEDIAVRASAAGLTVHRVIDAGKTYFKGIATFTCLAIGPNDSDNIDKITNHLKLY